MSQAVQKNGTKPLSKTWELGLYELQGTPQEAIMDGLEIVASPEVSAVNECPRLLGYVEEHPDYKGVFTLFLPDCIITALSSGNKECPTCQKERFPTDH